MILVQMTVRIMQLGDGPGGSYMLGQNQAENPGYTSSQTYGEVPAAQYAELSASGVMTHRPSGQVSGVCGSMASARACRPFAAFCRSQDRPRSAA